MQVLCGGETGHDAKETEEAVNEPSRDSEVSMLRVWQVAYDHVQKCGSGDCNLCGLFDELTQDPRRQGWEQAIREAAEQETYRRQVAHEQNEERKDAL